MLLRPLSALTLVCAVFGLVPAAWSQAASGAAAPGEMRAWLMRIHAAASQKNFQGTFVVSGGGSVSSARIAHFCDGANQYERIESLDGQARQVFRHNDVVQTVWPGSRLALVEQRDQVMSFPALLQAGDDRIVDHYEVQQKGLDRVAGHEANVLLVRARDNLRYGYRLWAEKASGLLLRADVLNERNEVLETAAFSEVAIGVRPTPEIVTQPMRKLDGFRVVRPTLTPTRLEAEGWTMRQAVAGFRQVSCVKRPMDANLPGESDGGANLVVQSIYSDGLTYVSVFIEPFNPQRHTRPIRGPVGATQTLMRRQGDWWVTVIGDVPPGTLIQFAEGLERRK
jgi:sigma-E factor negative regulatory protein RseB